MLITPAVSKTISQLIPEKPLRDTEHMSVGESMLNSKGLNTFQVRKNTSDTKRPHYPTCNSPLSLGHNCRAKGSGM